MPLTRSEINALREYACTQGILDIERRLRERALHLDELDISDEERDHLRKVRKNMVDCEQLNREIQEIFPEVRYYEELARLKINYQAVIPILLYWFPRIDNIAIKMSIANLLSIPSAGPLAAPAIVQEMKKIVETHPATVGRDLHVQAMAQSAMGCSTDGFWGDIADLAVDLSIPEHARMWFVRGLIKRGNRKALSLFGQFLNSDDKWVIVHALKEIRRRKAAEFYDRIVKLQAHESKEVREEAEKTFVILEKEKNKPPKKPLSPRRVKNRSEK